jgi:hypothetical protein
MVEKIAQQRSFLSKVRESLGLQGKILEELNIEFAHFMNKLRETDERIRDQASDLKEAAKNSISFVRHRDYLSAAANISSFHERVRRIAAELQHFNSTVDLRHYSFLLQQMSDEDKHKLFQYNPSADIKLADLTASNSAIKKALIKQAGLSDWWMQKEAAGWWFYPSTPGDDAARRGTAAKALEKRFKVKFLAELKKATTAMTERTYKFYRYLLSTFKKLGWAVATRKIDKYMLIAQDFIKNFEIYHKAFLDYYTKQITPIKEQQEKVLAEERTKEEAEKKSMEGHFQARAPQRSGPAADIGLEGKSGPYVKEHQPLPIPANEEGPIGSHMPPPRVEPVSIEPIKNTIEKNYPIDLIKQKEKLMYEQPQLDDLMQNLRDRKANEFLNTIQKLASDDNVDGMIAEILSQSEQLEEVNAEQSLQLLAIAEGMIEEYKTAGIMDFFKGKTDEKQSTKEPQQEDKKPLPFVLTPR